MFSMKAPTRKWSEILCLTILARVRWRSITGEEEADCLMMYSNYKLQKLLLKILMCIIEMHHKSVYLSWNIAYLRSAPRLKAMRSLIHKA